MSGHKRSGRKKEEKKVKTKEEERLRSLEEEVKGISQKIDQLMINRSVPAQPTIVEGDVNPWALEAVQIWEATLKSTGEQISRSISTYQKTIKALLDKGKPLTASEIGKITKRNRNTETAYLRRLYLAGFVDRIPDGKKIKYCIRKEKKEEIRRAFNL